MNLLFRREVLDARRDAWLGQVQLVQPIPVRLSVLVSLALIAACVALTWLGSYTRRVHAAGTMMPEGGLITVASPVAGVVSSAAAAEGLKVQAGRLLYTVDVDATSTAGPTQQRVIAALTAQQEALRRERALRLSSAVVEKQSLTNQLANLMAQRTQLDTQLERDAQTLPPVRAAMERLRGAAEQHVVTDSAFQNQAYVFSQLLAQDAQFQQTSLSVEGRIAEVSSDLALYGDKLDRDVSEIDRSISELDQKVAESQARRAVLIRAPADGVLTALRVHAGQAVESGAALVTLLPSAPRLRADLYVDSSAIGFIREGAPVLLRYAAFPFERFGLYGGRVTEVTRAPVQASGGTGTSDAAAAPAPSAPGRGNLYRVVVEPTLPYVVAYGAHRPLEAGMEVEADIALDRRRLYQWVLDPMYQVERRIGVVAGAPVTPAPAP